VTDTALDDFRSQVLAECEASPTVVDELLPYTQSPFQAEAVRAFPFEDEPHVEHWARYAEDARRRGALAALRERFVQLRFPIREGISQEEPYKQATLFGRFEAAEAFAPGLELSAPERLELLVCPSLGGRVPVIVAGDRADFVALSRAFANRNEPMRVSGSTGACLIKGFNNWDRIARYRRDWEALQREPVTDRDWYRELNRIAPRTELYVDRFVLLSRGPYSATRAADAGFGEQEWLAHSLAVRREHELTHYFTYRVFGVIRDHLADELVCDFVGLVRTFGRYDGDLALRFLGLESFPDYREGGRLQNYCRGISDAGLRVLRVLAYRAVRNLEHFAAERAAALAEPDGLARITCALAGLSLEELASSEMTARTEARLG
jgi:hypothetical protein